MSYSVLLSAQANEYIAALDEKSERIITENLRKLEDDPYPRPGSGPGDKEKLTVDGEEMYRLHIGRTHTAFYDVIEDSTEVRIVRYCRSTRPTTGTDSTDTAKGQSVPSSGYCSPRLTPRDEARLYNVKVLQQSSDYLEGASSLSSKYPPAAHVLAFVTHCLERGTGKI